MDFKNSAIEVLEIIKNELPACFKRGKNKLPLAVGIQQSVITYYIKDQRFDTETLKKAIALYTKGTKYLNSVIYGTSRINIDGNPVSIVTLHEQEYAQKILNTRAKLVN